MKQQDGSVIQVKKKTHRDFKKQKDKTVYKIR